MNTQEAVTKLANALKNDKGFFLTYQANIAIEFKEECQRFRRIKNSQNLNVVDLDSISNNAAKNFLNRFIQS